MVLEMCYADDVCTSLSIPFCGTYTATTAIKHHCTSSNISRNNSNVDNQCDSFASRHSEHVTSNLYLFVATYNSVMPAGTCTSNTCTTSACMWCVIVYVNGNKYIHVPACKHVCIKAYLHNVHLHTHTNQTIKTMQMYLCAQSWSTDVRSV